VTDAPIVVVGVDHYTGRPRVCMRCQLELAPALVVVTTSGRPLGDLCIAACADCAGDLMARATHQVFVVTKPPEGPP